VFDAVAVLISADGAKLLVNESTARDFVADAFAHLKLIAYTPAAAPLLAKAGVQADAGCIDVTDAQGIPAFVKACGELRVWARAPKVKQV
jgi:catalase